MNSYRSILIISIFLCTACADPEKAAQEASVEARETWKNALATLDPEERMSLFSMAVSTVEGMVEDYPEASATKDITIPVKKEALSLTKMKATKDSFAQYAQCFASPTAECVIPLATPGRADDSDAEPAWQAKQQVCQSGFDQAQTTLAKFKANRPYYAQAMIDLAFAATECDKPDAVQSALAAYRDVLPSQGQQRIEQLARILNTPAFSAGHALIIKAIESELETSQVSKQFRAGALLSLALGYAANQQPAKAVKRYNEVTKVLNFHPDTEVERSIAVSYLQQGAVSEALKYTPESNQDFYIRRAINEALASLALRYNLLKSKTAISLNIERDTDLEAFLQPVTGESIEIDLNVIEKIANLLLQKVNSYKVGVDILGPHGVDTAFALIALLEHKLGEPERAKLSLSKAQSLRSKFSDDRYGRQSFANPSTNYQLQVQALFALRNGDIESAMQSLAKNKQLYGIWPELIIRQVAATGDVERTLTIVGELSPNNKDQYNQIMLRTMVEAGKIENAKQLIDAHPSSNLNEYYASLLLRDLIESGDAHAIEALSQQYGLDKSKYGRFGMLLNMVRANVKAKNLGAAEKLAREAYKLGSDIDKNGAPGIRHDSHIAKDVIWLVMGAGLIELGFELYKHSPVQDASMLTAAFNGQITRPQITSILVLAFDTLTSYEREKVFNHAYSWTLDNGNHKS